MRSEEGKKAYLKRMYTLEPVFGDIKWNLKKIVKGVNEGTAILSFEEREEMIAEATL